MFKKTILIFFFAYFICINLLAEAQCKLINENNKINALILTVPKCGTNLILKLIPMITECRWDLYEAGRCISERANIYEDHLWDSYDVILNSEDWTKIIIIRDPRDAIVSLRNWLNKTWVQDQSESGNIYSEYFSLSPNERINFLISRTDKGMLPYFIKSAARWIKYPQINKFRFEDLVGKNGGGNNIKQKKSIKKLGLLLGENLGPKKLSQIQTNLFGGTNTFFKGQIGAWKTEFNEENKILFKEKLGKELIDLGYESNYDW